MAEVLVSAIGPLIGGDALALLVQLIPRHFGLRDMGGAKPVGDPAETWEVVRGAFQRHQPISPYYLMDFFRELGLVGRDPGGMAILDMALAGRLAEAAYRHAGDTPHVALEGFSADAISSDRLRYSQADIASNAAAISDRWND